jgi:hypothetical protein
MAMLQLTPQVELLYKEKHNVPAIDQYIFKQSLEQTLALPTAALTNWVFKASNRLQRAKKRTRLQTKKLQQLHPFFTKPSTTRQSKNNNKNIALVKQTVTPTKNPRHSLKQRLLATSLHKFFPILQKRNNKIPKNDLLPP